MVFYSSFSVIQCFVSFQEWLRHTGSSIIGTLFFPVQPSPGRSRSLRYFFFRFLCIFSLAVLLTTSVIGGGKISRWLLMNFVFEWAGKNWEKCFSVRLTGSCFYFILAVMRIIIFEPLYWYIFRDLALLPGLWGVSSQHLPRRAREGAFPRSGFRGDSGLHRGSSRPLLHRRLPS